MKRNHCAFWGFVLAAALLLAGCGRADSGSTSGSSSAGSSADASQTAAWKTGLGVLTEASDSGRTGKIHTVAAAVLLDGEGEAPGRDL